MTTCTNEEASKMVCPMAIRVCAGARCMAWQASSISDGGSCGMVPSTMGVGMPFVSGELDGEYKKANPQILAERAHAKRGMPAKE